MADEKNVHGTFCWNELMTRDTDAATKFYGELLGWQAADSGMEGMNYTMFKAGDKVVGGLMATPPEVPAEESPRWLAYVTVDDIDATAKKIVELGGKVLHGPEDIPNMGRHCVAQDPTGAIIGFITFAS